MHQGHTISETSFSSVAIVNPPYPSPSKYTEDVHTSWRRKLAQILAMIELNLFARTVRLERVFLAWIAPLHSAFYMFP